MLILRLQCCGGGPRERRVQLRPRCSGAQQSAAGQRRMAIMHAAPVCFPASGKRRNGCILRRRLDGSGAGAESAVGEEAGRGEEPALQSAGACCRCWLGGRCSISSCSCLLRLCCGRASAPHHHPSPLSAPSPRMRVSLALPLLALAAGACAAPAGAPESRAERGAALPRRTAAPAPEQRRDAEHARAVAPRATPRPVMARELDRVSAGLAGKSEALCKRRCAHMHGAQ
jgi:hypothetical protein